MLELGTSSKPWVMRSLQVLAGVLLMVQGAGHTFIGTPSFHSTLSQDAIWFAGAGLAMIFLGLLNILAVPGATVWSAWAVPAANLPWAILMAGLLLTSRSGRVVAAATIAVLALVASIGVAVVARTGSST